MHSALFTLYCPLYYSTLQVSSYSMLTQLYFANQCSSSTVTTLHVVLFITGTLYHYHSSPLVLFTTSTLHYRHLSSLAYTQHPSLSTTSFITLLYRYLAILHSLNCTLLIDALPVLASLLLLPLSMHQYLYYI